MISYAESPAPEIPSAELCARCLSKIACAGMDAFRGKHGLATSDHLKVAMDTTDKWVRVSHGKLIDTFSFEELGFNGAS